MLPSSDVFTSDGAPLIPIQLLIFSPFFLSSSCISAVLVSIVRVSVGARPVSLERLHSRSSCTNPDKTSWGREERKSPRKKIDFCKKNSSLTSADAPLDSQQALFWIDRTVHRLFDQLFVRLWHVTGVLAVFWLVFRLSLARLPSSNATPRV